METPIRLLKLSLKFRENTLSFLERRPKTSESREATQQYKKEVAEIQEAIIKLKSIKK